jgi:hypothetical protein
LEVGGMSYPFKFRGGVNKPTTQSTEKFLMFFVVGGAEIPLHVMMREGLVWRQQDETGFDIPDSYYTGANVAKIFTSAVSFGDPKRFHSFYIRFVKDNPRVTIRGFGERSKTHFFEGNISFMKQSEVLALLDENNPSRGFVVRQKTLPVETLKRLITVDRSALKKGVRHIRIGKRKQQNERR